VWASLLKGKDAVIQMERRDPSAFRTGVALTDGESCLTDSSRREAERHPDPGSDTCVGEALASRYYPYRNRTRMRYHVRNGSANRKCLAHGWPIANGPVEGACKNLIEDRMERSGMRWTEPMAEAIVPLRAVYLSGDFDLYWAFHIEQDQKRLYPDAWSVVLK
jgi:hypothetical protein